MYALSFTCIHSSSLLPTHLHLCLLSFTCIHPYSLARSLLHLYTLSVTCSYLSSLVRTFLHLYSLIFTCTHSSLLLRTVFTHFHLYSPTFTFQTQWLNSATDVWHDTSYRWQCNSSREQLPAIKSRFSAFVLDVISRIYRQSWLCSDL